LAGLGFVSCTKDTTAPSSSPVRLAVVEGADQFVLPGQTAAVLLGVHATHATTGRPVTDVEVTWRLVEGSGAVLSPTTATTDEVGVAGTAARAGSSSGTYRFEATAPRLVGQPATFVLHAVAAPVIDAVSPTTVTGGQIVEIHGSGFSGTAEQHRILFGGLRGTILDASATRITARAPDCLLTRTTDVRVTLGNVASNAVGVQTTAGAVTPVAIAAGQSVTLTDPAQLACLAIENVPRGSGYLLVAQNAARMASVGMRYELTAIAAGGMPVTFERGAATLHRNAASDFELALRQRERNFGPATGPGEGDAAAAVFAPDPAVGDRRDFNVLTEGGGTRRTSATVRMLSQRAIVYVDDGAPQGGPTAADLSYITSLFDDPIHTTETTVFGPPSDIDGNGRVIILFTPAVNQLTGTADAGFIAGYFHGCDLVAATRCSATNRGEILYSMVPDPSGEFGRSRSRDLVRLTVPAVLAHEFQHMISFSRKNDRLDVLWLSEGLAHAAENLVGAVLAQRGDILAAPEFQRPNYIRAGLYLARTAQTPLVAEASPGALEQRGAAWLLVEYIAGHYGGNVLLGRLTSSAESGADNIEQSTGVPWSAIFAGFSTALWADGRSEFAAAPAPAYTFANLDLRDLIGPLDGPFPLRPPAMLFQDFQLGGTLAAGGQDYLLLGVDSGASTLRFGFTGLLGGPFEDATRPQLTLLRIR
jgi:hypothetical protein